MSHSLFYGDCLFETVRVEGGPHRFERHVDRFVRSAAALKYKIEEIEQGVEALQSLKERADGLWRVTFVRGPDVFGDWKSEVLFDPRSLTVRPRPSLGVVEGYIPTDSMSEFKTTSYLRPMMARRSALAAGFDDALMVSRCGRLGESSMANVFLVFGDHLVTPEICGILPGTTRAAILENARNSGIQIEERAVFESELAEASEVILTSAGVLAQSASSLEGRALNEYWGPILAEFACA
jgi:branched-chain amino acid aminotransferase